MQRSVRRSLLNGILIMSWRFFSSNVWICGNKCRCRSLWNNWHTSDKLTSESRSKYWNKCSKQSSFNLNIFDVFSSFTGISFRPWPVFFCCSVSTDGCSHVSAGRIENGCCLFASRSNSYWSKAKYAFWFSLNVTWASDSLFGSSSIASISPNLRRIRWIFGTVNSVWS